MILSQKSHDDIIWLLLKYGSCTAKDLHMYLTQGGVESITLAQLYNILKLLYNCQIISKHDKKYHINTIWIHQLEQVVSTHRSDHQVIDRGSLQSGQHIVLKASTLGDLDPIWGDVFHSLAKRSSIKEIYSYYSHAYYALGMYETEKGFFNTKIYEFYSVIQHRNILNDYGIQLYGQIGVDHVGYAKKTLLFNTEGRVINVIGPYIIDFLMPEILEHYFAYHFNTTQDMSQFNQLQFNSLFQMPIQCQIKVIYDSGLADQYRHIIENQLQG